MTYEDVFYKNGLLLFSSVQITGESLTRSSEAVMFSGGSKP